MDTRSIKHVSASSHEPLVMAAAAFRTDNRGSPGIVIVTRNKLAADELVYRSSHLGLCGVYRLTTEQIVQELSRKRKSCKTRISTPVKLSWSESPVRMHQNRQRYAPQSMSPVRFFATL